MKQLYERYRELIHQGPPGLFSRGDTQQIAAHIQDGCIGAPLISTHAPATIVDVGSGGGIPIIPLTIELSNTTTHAIESQHWKASFLHACAQTLGLESRITVHCVRAEEAPQMLGREVFDVGTARALAAPLVVAEYLSPLIRVGGTLVLWSTHAQATTQEVVANTLLGLGTPRLHPAPTPLRADGVLIEWPKVATCSARVPRRVGVAARKPLR